MIALKAPTKGTKIHEEPLVQIIEDVLTLDECYYIISIAQPHLKPAFVAGAEGNKKSDGRTGKVHWIKHNTSPEITEIVNRVSDIVGFPASYAESIQVVYYGETQQYKPHFDAFDLDTEKGKKITGESGQRLATALLYLNEVEGGGGTTFPKVEKQVSPKPGRAVVFHNCYEGTNKRHPKSLHGGMPVEKGEKWACNLWYRERPLKK